jgi:DNA-binding SARP family transcriptional activator
LLASLSMTWAGQPIGFATNAAPALLADLAVEAGRPHSYEILAVMLYSDPPRAAAYTNLRQTLPRVRRGCPST